MAITSTRVITLNWAGDIQSSSQPPLAAAPNLNSPYPLQVVNLASGNNTITLPTGDAEVANAVTIVPPLNNGVTLILKGVNGDTGITIHLTDPTTVTFGAGSVSFVINASNTVSGLKLYWS